jgi:hypothetical protein
MDKSERHSRALELSPRRLGRIAGVQQVRMKGSVFPLRLTGRRPLPHDRGTGRISRFGHAGERRGCVANANEGFNVV